MEALVFRVVRTRECVLSVGPLRACVRPEMYVTTTSYKPTDGISPKIKLCVADGVVESADKLKFEGRGEKVKVTARPYI